jgi:sec-independent protein translocase protein TatB
MFGSIGMPELVIIMVIALIIFGPRKLPELGRSLGKSLGEFRRASNELRSTLEDEIRLEETREQKAKMAAEQASAVHQPEPNTVTPSPVGTPPPTTTPAEDTVSHPGDEPVSRPTPGTA